jgi:hypothetical protein
MDEREKYQRRLQPLAELLKQRFLGKRQHIYIEQRWQAPAAKAWEQKNRHMMRAYVAQWVALGGGASLPVLVTASAQSSGDVRGVLSVAAIIISLVVALSTTFLQVTKADLRWNLTRRLRDGLLHEAWMAAAGIGKYGDDPDKDFGQFVGRVEKIFEETNADYYANIASAPRSDD